MTKKNTVSFFAALVAALAIIIGAGHVAQAQAKIQTATVETVVVGQNLTAATSAAEITTVSTSVATTVTKFYNVANSGQADILGSFPLGTDSFIPRNALLWVVPNGTKMAHEDDKFASLMSCAGRFASADLVLFSFDPYVGTFYAPHNDSDDNSVRLLFLNKDNRPVGVPARFLVRAEGFKVISVEPGVEVRSTITGEVFGLHQLVPFTTTAGALGQRTDIIRVTFNAERMTEQVKLSVSYQGAKAVPVGQPEAPGGIAVGLVRLTKLDAAEPSFCPVDNVVAVRTPLSAFQVLSNPARYLIGSRFVQVLGQNMNRPMPASSGTVRMALQRCNNFRQSTGDRLADVRCDWLLAQFTLSETELRSKQLGANFGAWSPFNMGLSFSFQLNEAYPVVDCDTTVSRFQQILVEVAQSGRNIDLLKLERVIDIMFGNTSGY